MRNGTAHSCMYAEFVTTWRSFSLLRVRMGIAAASGGAIFYSFLRRSQCDRASIKCMCLTAALDTNTFKRLVLAGIR